MKILIINQPLNNRGDESAHRALVKAILASNTATNITVLFVKSNPDSVHQFSVVDPCVKYENVKGKGLLGMGIKAVRYKLPFLFYILPGAWPILKLYRKADMVVCAPGGICMGGFQNWTHLFFLFLAKWMHKPLAYYGRSIGPFPVKTHLNRVFKKRSYEIMNYFSFISIRDKESEQLARQIGIKYVSTVDTAFLDNPMVEIPSELKILLGNQPYVVFVPNSLNWHFNYKNTPDNIIISFYGDILKAITRHYGNIHIVMLPQTFNYANPKANDVNYFRVLKRTFPQYDITVVNDIYSSDIQQTVISKARLVVGARYHSVVFALNQTVPFVALSYEHKISGLLETLNKTKCMVDISSGFENGESSVYVEQFCLALTEADSDQNACKKAKSLARKCMEQFLSKCSTTCR